MDWIYNFIGRNFKEEREVGRAEVIWGEGGETY